MTQEFCRYAHGLMHLINDLDFIIARLGDIKTPPEDFRKGYSILCIKGHIIGPSYERHEFSECFEVSPETLDVIIEDVTKQREQLQEKFAKL